MHKNSDVLEHAINTMHAIADNHSKDINRLSDRLDRFADTNTEVLTKLSIIMDSNNKLLSKMDRAEANHSDHESRIKVIESLRAQTKDTKASTISLISVVVAVAALLFSVYSSNKPQLDRPRYENKSE